MKRAVLTLYLSLLALIMINGCGKNSSPTSPYSGACEVPTKELVRHFTIDGGGFSNLTINQDSVIRTTNQYAENQYYEDSFAVVLSSGDTAHFDIKMTYGGFANMSFPWSDWSVDTTMQGYGCVLIIRDAHGNTRTFRSTSGSTNIGAFPESNPKYVDFYSTYCGSLKDSVGNTITITNGRWYLAFA